MISMAVPQDDAELRRLLRENPVPGPVALSYEREPTFFIDQSDTVVAREEGRIVGLGTRSTYRAYVNGAIVPIGYLGQLRLDRRHRGRAHLVFRGYEKLRELHEERRDASFYVTTLIDGNEAAERLLTSGHPRLPRYRRLDSLRTLILKVRSIRPVEPRSGGVEDVRRSRPRYQFERAWDELPPVDVLVSKGGCLAFWDQSAFKQVVVRGYSRALRTLRPLLRLPRVGEPLRLAYLSHLAVDEDRALVDLVRAAAGRARDRGIDYLVLGLSARNPRLAALRKAFSAVEYGSTIYLVHWEDAVPDLDSRPSHLEVATL